MISPVFALIVAVVGAVGAVAGASALDAGRKIGPKLTLADMAPLAPWEGPPLPRFTRTKPELLAELKRR
ncbi:hypothetical protein LCGC14_1193280 [marine sediment metagenome]|uniref:Uncharacterized protein n=1 Tax=marine sediment metagenome TaxID=412755 RepID=A0A0F9P1H9_9ZZZZ